MENKNDCKFAIISHVLPPMPSGQSIVLFKLLNDFPAGKYILLTALNFQPSNRHFTEVQKLPAKQYHLKSRRLNYLEKKIKIPSVSGLYNYCCEVINRAKQIINIVKQKKCSTIICCSGNLIDMPAAFIASKKLKHKFIPYLFDDFIYQWVGPQRWIARLIEPKIIKASNKIIVPNDFLQQEYWKRYKKNSVIIHNPCEINCDIKEKSSNIYFNHRYINIVYSGSIYHAHYDAFHRLLDAINLNNKYEIRLHLYTSQSKTELMDNGFEDPRIIHHQHVSNTEIMQILKQSDILFLPLAFNSPIPEVIRTSAPGKMGEYLSTGKPILVHAPKRCYVSWFFRKHKCGIVVDKKSTRLLAKAIEYIAMDQELQKCLKKNSTIASERYFNIDSVREKFFGCIYN